MNSRNSPLSSLSLMHTRQRVGYRWFASYWKQAPILTVYRKKREGVGQLHFIGRPLFCVAVVVRSRFVKVSMLTRVYTAYATRGQGESGEAVFSFS